MDELKKVLIVFVAHIDDIELSCLSYVFKHHKSYDTINLYIASKWNSKQALWKTNLQKIRNRCKGTEIIYHNLHYEQRRLMTHFDNIKDDFYKKLKFSENISFDLMTHDIEDCHTDHVAIAMISKGLFKYTEKYLSIYSPSTISFKPNFWISLDDKDYRLKKELCDVYNIDNEQSYTKLGYYLQSEDHYNIGSAYEIENFTKTISNHTECFKILKWRL